MPLPSPRSYDQSMPYPRGHYRRRRGLYGMRWGDSGWHAPWESAIVARSFARRSSARARLWLPVIISLFVQVPAVFLNWHPGAGVSLGLPETTDRLIQDLAIALVGPLALIGARRFPGPVVAIVALGGFFDILTHGASDGPPYIAFAFAIGSAIVRGARVWAWITIAVSWVTTLVVWGTLHLSWQPWRLVGISIGILVVVGLAEAIRTRRIMMTEMSQRVTARQQSEVQAERVRIARELHDVLAHSLSQINVQAGVGLHLIEKQPEKAADALASIKETSKTALDEVRSVLGVLRAEDGADPNAPLVPEPDLSRLDGLAASVTAQGIEVSVHSDLQDVPKAIQLAIYRIVQESLTNVVRHAEASAVTVQLSESNGHYLVSVLDNGNGAAEAKETGGRGLLGMRERAELLGGTLSAGPAAGGGFQIAASIPSGAHHD
jgi:signal transduction histidine kinase